MTPATTSRNGGLTTLAALSGVVASSVDSSRDACPAPTLPVRTDALEHPADIARELPALAGKGRP